MRRADFGQRTLFGATAWLSLALLGAACDAPRHDGRVAAARVSPLPSGTPLAFVSNEDSGDISVIDLRSDKVLTTLLVG